MSLIYASIENVRRIERAELDLHPGQNLIWGPNGSGKSSLLEALFLLGRGRSFRTRKTERVIRHGATELVVFGRLAGTPEKRIGVQSARGSCTVGKVGGAFLQSLAELSQAFPVQVIDPGVHKLIEEGAPRRRRWMDWAVFHVEPTFFDIWSRYQKTLRQRNAALRAQPEQAFAWDPELIRLGEPLAESRRAAIDRLQPYWSETVQALTGLQIDLLYSRGWSREGSLADALRHCRVRDQARGLTHAGPHRADIHLRLDGVPIRDVASRGQQKLIAAALILAQLRMLQGGFGTTPTLLLDDPAAELDPAHLAAFIAEVRRLKTQLVITSLSANASLFGAPDRVFHVEQGRVGPV
ncbi:MAG: DNA replication/repair protein RecF [Steroidobacteraceae bacterium]